MRHPRRILPLATAPGTSWAIVSKRSSSTRTAATTTATTARRVPSPSVWSSAAAAAATPTTAARNDSSASFSVAAAASKAPPRGPRFFATAATTAIPAATATTSSRTIGCPRTMPFSTTTTSTSSSPPPSGGDGDEKEERRSAGMPLTCRDMDVPTLVTLSELGHYGARKEALIRHVAGVEGVGYDEAVRIYETRILPRNRQYMFLLALPYQVGIAAALTAGFASVPLVFDLHAAHWFNEHFVTTDVPEPKDLETVLEVGSWTWNWMEPPLGQVSFFLLCLQYSRSQIQNLGIKPYTSRVKHWRAKRLVEAFPRYDPSVLAKYSEASPLYTSQ